MVKVLPTEQRRAFTKAFREVFEVPAESKQIVPFITELRHLQFIDRFTVEASGGIAA
jgi:Ser/Thr protein kinase RdoA (MazF antagonist)